MLRVNLLTGWTGPNDLPVGHHGGGLRMSTYKGPSRASPGVSGGWPPTKKVYLLIVKLDWHTEAEEGDGGPRAMVSNDASGGRTLV